MSVFFAMIGEGDDRRPAFFLTRGSAPEGAVEINEGRHRKLLDALSEGREIDADASGRPVVTAAPRASAAAVRSALTASIRREAEARILAVSPVWQQLNDMREPGEAGAIRFARIDAIRAASNAIEDLAASLPFADLAAFPVANHMLWPEFD